MSNAFNTGEFRISPVPHSSEFTKQELEVLNLLVAEFILNYKHVADTYPTWKKAVEIQAKLETMVRK